MEDEEKKNRHEVKGRKAGGIYEEGEGGNF